MQNRELKWYAIYTKPRFEKKANILLIEKNIQTYLPLYISYRKWSDRIKKVELPLFPSYIFVRIPITRCHDILSTEGIIKFVKFNGKPVPVPDWQIENIKILIDEGIPFSEIDGIDIKKNDFVEIISGKLKGLKGYVKQINKKRNIIIKLDVLDKTLMISLSRYKIKLINRNCLNNV